MEAQLSDIRDRHTVNSLAHLKENIMDCAKNIKSNDLTFGLDTSKLVSSKLTNLMDEYIGLTQQLEAFQQALPALNITIDNRDDTDEFLDVEEYKKAFVELIDGQMEQLTNFNDNARSDLEKIIRPIDEEVQVEDQPRQIPKDPITMREIKVAVKSSVCHHIYDKDSIEDYFRQKEKNRRGARVQCPKAGCANKAMQRSELVLDRETNKLIQSL